MQANKPVLGWKLRTGTQFSLINHALRVASSAFCSCLGWEGQPQGSGGHRHEDANTAANTVLTTAVDTWCQEFASRGSSALRCAGQPVRATPKTEALRALERRISDAVYRALLADAASYMTPTDQAA